jgi:hypothetical protein
MRGLTQLEVALLKDAASPHDAETPWSPAVNEALIQLEKRRLISYRECYRNVWGGIETFIVGVITPLGRLALSIALTEPSLIHPNAP